MAEIKQITVRISDDLFNEIKKEADQIGSSCNSLMMVLMKLGLKVYNGKVTIQQKIE